MRKKSLAVLNFAALALAAFTIAVGVVAFLPGSREIVEANFGAIRALSYAGWALGLLVLAWGGGLAAGLGRFSLASIAKVWRDADLKRVRRALAVAFAGNALALAASPLGLVLGVGYTWEAYVVHTVASLFLVAATSFVCLVRLRAFVDDIAPAPIPIPSRAGFVEPAGF
jgi:hypothetical protein